MHHMMLRTKFSFRASATPTIWQGSFVNVIFYLNESVCVSAVEKRFARSIVEVKLVEFVREHFDNDRRPFAVSNTEHIFVAPGHIWMRKLYETQRSNF